MNSTSPSELGEKPELKYLELTKLFVDATYQRPTETSKSQKNIAYIRDNWSWRDCGALTVVWVSSKKKFAIIDGQHRWKAACQRKDIPELPCVIIQEVGTQDQAKSFVGINRHRVVLTNIANYHALIAAGNEGACEVAEFLKDCEIIVPPMPVPGGITEARQLQCIQAIGELFNECSKNQIKWALTIIPEAYGERRGQMRSCLIKMLAKFSKNNPGADREVAIRTLKTIDAKQFESEARISKKISRISTIDAMQISFMREYRRLGGKSSEPKPVRSVTIADIEYEQSIVKMKEKGRLSLNQICDKLKAKDKSEKEKIAHIFYHGTAQPVN